MKKALFIIIPIVLILGGVLGGAYYIYENTININTIYSGITIDGYEVSGKTKNGAIEFLMGQKEIEDMDRSINFFHEDYNYEVTLKDFGYTYDYENAVDKAYELGRHGNPFVRYKEINELKNSGFDISLEPEYDRDLVLKIVDKIEDDVNQEKKDATFDFNGGSFKVTDDINGKSVVKGDLINLIVDNIYELKDLEIPVETEAPKVTKELLARINGVIGEFSTSFKGSSSGRIQNIRQASKSVSNLLLLPGDEVSFNETVGPINQSTGFTEAPVILNGELTPGLGGGVCQSSTTLYNALLLADVSIVERHPHSIAASYVPRGTDGAVARGYLDLKFKNDYDFPIYTQSKIIGDRIYFQIYGDTKAKDYTVKIEPELIETRPYNVREIFDETAAPGTREMQQEGRTGYKVRTFKSIIKDGKVIERKQITFDYYRERDFIYKVGPALPVSQTPDTSVPVDSMDSVESPIDEDTEVIDVLP